MGMAAVVGGDQDEVLAAIEAAGLTPANVNGAGQIVAAGPVEGIEKLQANPPAKARVMPLSVAGAFHTDYMASAREELEDGAPDKSLLTTSPKGETIAPPETAGDRMISTSAEMRPV